MVKLEEEDKTIDLPARRRSSGYSCLIRFAGKFAYNKHSDDEYDFLKRESYNIIKKTNK
ncbi:hypothetical protein [Bacillus sp. FJAT-27251]|uniref:hypothetical protein n=1 Tax=Bacillus sp. FJAT-27251 TaxID=1684142 RepID=UPI000AD4BF80|nr:hypothetical protein [Bacillus sp. FJAT-27251]